MLMQSTILQFRDGHTERHSFEAYCGGVVTLPGLKDGRPVLIKFVAQGARYVDDGIDYFVNYGINLHPLEKIAMGDDNPLTRRWMDPLSKK